MSVYKMEKCPECDYKREEARPKKKANPCPQKDCTGTMSYSAKWYIKFYSNGKRYVEAVSPSKDIAKKILTKRKNDVYEERNFNKAPSTPWNKAVKEFKTLLLGKDFKEGDKPTRSKGADLALGTKNMYTHSLRVLTLHFGRYTLDQITQKMVEDYKIHRREDGMALASINRELGTLKRLYSLCDSWSFIEDNPAKRTGLKFIREVKQYRENNARDRTLADDEVEQLLDICLKGGTYKDNGKKKIMLPNPALHLAISIALETGLRKHGCHSLRWREVDFKEGFIKKVVKGNKEVIIPLTDKLTAILKEYKAESKVISLYVIPSTRNIGSAVGDLKSAFRVALKIAGIKDFRFHDLRHTFATNFLRRTGNIKVLQEILGHSKITQTERYAHVLKDHLREAMDEYERRSML